MSLIVARRLDEAMAEFQDALRVDPAFPDAIYGLGECLACRGRIDDAIARFLECLQINSRHIPARFGLGNAYLTKGKINDAIRQFTMVSATEPGHVQSRFSIGKCLEKKNLIGDALQNYQGITVSFPDFLEAYTAAARCMITLGREKDAVKEYRRAITRAPGKIEIREDLINLLGRIGLFEDAIAENRAILAQIPGNARRDLEIHLNIASLMDRGGLISEAIEEYALVRKIDPVNSYAYTKHQILLREREKIDKLTNRYLGHVINRMEKIGDHFREGMKIYLDGCYNDAMGEFDREINQSMTAEACFGMGACLVRTGSLLAAVPYFKAAVKVNDDFPEAHTMLGILYERHGLLYEAYEEYARGVKEAREQVSTDDRRNGKIDSRSAEPAYKFYRLG